MSRSQERIAASALLSRCVSWVALFALALLPRLVSANGADLPPEINLQGFLKVEEGHLRLVVRVPLSLLSTLGLPKRGPGYLDLARIDDSLMKAAALAGRQIELFEDSTPLVPTTREARIAVLSDRSFQSYDTALAHLRGPRLPIETDLFWNQGFFDAEIEYPVRSSRPDLWIRVNVAPELGHRIKLRLEFLPASGPARFYELPGGSGRIPLDPRWYEAAWLFVKKGGVDAVTLDRLLFVLCLVAPFTRFWSLLAVVLAMTGMQAVTLTAGAWGHGPDARWLAPLFDVCLAVAILYLAIENVVAPSLRRRWFVGVVVGLLGGFGLGQLLADDWSLAGTHPFVALVSFNLGVALAEVVSLVIALVALRLLFAYVLGARVGAVILSAVIGHSAWHRMMDNAHRLEHAIEGGLATASVGMIAWWLLLGLVVGAIAWFLPSQFGGAPISPFLREARSRGVDE